MVLFNLFPIHWGGGVFWVLLFILYWRLKNFETRDMKNFETLDMKNFLFIENQQYDRKHQFSSFPKQFLKSGSYFADEVYCHQVSKFVVEL